MTQVRGSLSATNMILILVIIIVVVSVPFLFIKPEPTFTLSVDSLNLVEGKSVDVKAFYDPDGEGKQEPIDVTEFVTWDVDDEYVAGIGRLPPISGMVVAYKPGSTTVRAAYGDFEGSIDVSVEKSKLAITCEPFKQQARVGEAVGYITVYHERGYPDYTYEWETDEGQTSSLITPQFTYQQPGTHYVDVVVHDFNKNRAEARCEPIEITAS